MAKDYKHVIQQAPKPRRPRPKARRRRAGMPGWVGVVLGIALTLAAGALWWLYAPSPKPPPRPAEKREQPPPIRYEFYRVLPERQVPVPSRAPPPKPAAYLVQVGSFKAFAPADRLKAQLAFLGIEASIERSSGLYRVRVGPFASEKEARAMRARLRAQGLEAIIVRR